MNKKIISLSCVGFGDYEVHSDGYVISKRSKIPKVLKPGTNRYGYSVVTLVSDKEKKSFFVHRLVAIAFHGNEHLKKTVNHKNGIKTDNRSSNLEWCTAQENINHAISSGLWINQTGSLNHCAKIDEMKVLAIKTYIQMGYRNKEISRLFNLSRSSVSQIRNGKTWRNTLLGNEERSKFYGGRYMEDRIGK